MRPIIDLAKGEFGLSGVALCHLVKASMNNAIWTTTNTPHAMLSYLEADRAFPENGRILATDRKCLLMGIPCTDKEFIEDTKMLYQSADKGIIEFCSNFRMWSAIASVHRSPLWFAKQFISAKEYPDIIRDVIGNPFKPITIHLGEVECYPFKGKATASMSLQKPLESWLTPAVRGLAEAAYQSVKDDGTLDNDLLGILADALDDAGCDNKLILVHLRYGSLNKHWRGCWVIDFLTGRK